MQARGDPECKENVGGVAMNDIVKLGMDLRDPQNHSLHRGCLQERLAGRPHPSERINSDLYKVNMVADVDDWLAFISLNKFY